MAEETKTTDSIFGSAQLDCGTTELAITRIRRKMAMVLTE
jgi:hypothetical protein